MSNPRFVLALTPLYRLLLAALSGALLSLAFPSHPGSPARLSLSSALGPLCAGAFAAGAERSRLQSWLCRRLDQRVSVEPAVLVLGRLYPRRRSRRRRGHRADGRLFGPFYRPLHWAVQRIRRAVGGGRRSRCCLCCGPGRNICSRSESWDFPGSYWGTAKRPCPTSSSTPPGPASLASPAGSLVSTRCFTRRSWVGASCSRALPSAISCLGSTLRARWQPSPLTRACASA